MSKNIHNFYKTNVLEFAIAKSIVEKYNGHIEVICKDGLTNFKVKMTSK